MFNHDTFSSWKMTPNSSDPTSCESVTFLQMFNDIGELSLRLRSKDGHKWMSSLNCLGSNNFVARIPHISRMWDDIIVKLFADIKTELNLQADMTTTTVGDLDVLPEPEGGRQEEVIEELEEFDVVKDEI